MVSLHLQTDEMNYNNHVKVQQTYPFQWGEADFLSLVGTGEGFECGGEGKVGLEFCHEQETTTQGIYKWSPFSHSLKPNVLAQGKCALIIQHLNTQSVWAHAYNHVLPLQTLLITCQVVHIVSTISTEITMPVLAFKGTCKWQNALERRFCFACHLNFREKK